MKQKFCGLAFSLLVLISLHTCPAIGAAELSYADEFDAGFEAYKKKDFKGAEDHFRKSIQKGNRSPGVWVYAGHAFFGQGKLGQAKTTYEQVIKSFKDSDEAKVAEQSLARVNAKLHPGASAQPAAAAAAPSTNRLLDRITVVPPQMGHPAVSNATISAIKSAIANLPAHIRKQLDESGAAIVIAPNMIDKWPESIKDLPEKDEAPTLAELPGRIYGKDMYCYERAKHRFTSALKPARTPKEMQHTVLNMCFQILDDEQSISRNPELRELHRVEADAVPASSREKMATFLKFDDWGPRETCSELAAEMFGAGADNSSDLNRFFPKSKQWLKKRLGL